MIDLLGIFAGASIRPVGRTHGGLRTRPHQEGPHLVQSQPQKVALVAAFASDVELLVLDESTGDLDPLVEEVLYRTTAERAGFAASTTANGAMRSFYGPAFGDSRGGVPLWVWSS